MKHEILQTCPPVIRDFLTYNETIKGKSALSVEGYFLDLQSFFRYLLFVRGLVDGKSEFCEIEIKSVDINLIKTVTISDLYAYLVFCKNERGNNAATRARNVKQYIVISYNGAVSVVFQYAESSFDSRNDIFRLNTFELKHSATAENSTVNIEIRVFCCGSNKSDFSSFDIVKKSLLLLFVEILNLIKI